MISPSRLLEPAEQPVGGLNRSDGKIKEGDNKIWHCGGKGQCIGLVYGRAMVVTIYDIFLETYLSTQFDCNNDNCRRVLDISHFGQGRRPSLVSCTYIWILAHHLRIFDIIFFSRNIPTQYDYNNWSGVSQCTYFSNLLVHDLSR